MYRSAIVNELGQVMIWCNDISLREQINILKDHPEWSIKCVEM